MVIYTSNMLENYLKNDWILEMMLMEEKEEDKSVRTHQWLKTMDNKRLIFSHVYGDILEQAGCEIKNKILDVGGGYTSLTRKMLVNSEYMLLDFMAHGGKEIIEKIECENKKEFWINSDWMEYDISQKKFDIIIANDIFPDVDQRLELFIDKYLPHCKELRLVLTFYNTPKYYRTKRVDDAEVLTFLSWDGEITGIKLRKYIENFIDTTSDEIEKLKDVNESIYWNGRQVVYIKLAGGIRE